MYRSFVLATALASCCTAAAPPSVLAQVDPAAVARRYVDAFNRGDVTGVVALSTDAAAVAHGRICTPACVADPAAVQRQYESDIANSVQLMIVDSHVAGNTVAIRIELRGNPTRAAGVERIVGTDTIEVRGDKITSLRFAPDLSDPQTVRFRDWARGQGQPPRQ